MPTYEYQCKDCKHRFEIWQKMTDEPLKICPECNGTIRRILFPAGIVFKGSGFYKTDHGSGGVLADTNANNSNGNTDGSESTSKTENTGESKTSGETASTTKVASESKAAATAD